MTWTAEQIREWFEAGQREERANAKEAARWHWHTEVRQWTPEEFDRLHAEYMRVE